MIGLDRERRQVHVAAFVDEDGRQVTPAPSLASDTLVLALTCRRWRWTRWRGRSRGAPKRT
jgi:NADH dehydrogenase